MFHLSLPLVICLPVSFLSGFMSVYLLPFSFPLFCHFTSPLPAVVGVQASGSWSGTGTTVTISSSHPHTQGP
jgi:hypothetical protein